MTENEAIKELNERIEFIEKYYKKETEKYKEVLETAVKSLTEIQQYRAIGAVEECQVARERQKKKRGIPYNSKKNHILVECPNCHKDMDLYYEYCQHCGQAVSWERDDE